MDTRKRISEINQRVAAIKAITKPYEAELDALHTELHYLKAKQFLDKYGLKMGEKFTVTNSLREQQRVYGWGNSAWPLGSVALIDGVRFSDGDRGGDEIVVKQDDSRTCTPAWVVLEGRRDYLSKQQEGE